jgi:hypothetical protein
VGKVKEIQSCALLTTEKASRVIDQISLTSALNAAEWSTSRSCRFTNWKTTPRSHRTGTWVGPRVRLDKMEKRELSYTSWNRMPIPRPSSQESPSYVGSVDFLQHLTHNLLTYGASRRLPTAAALVQTRVWSCGIL